MATISSASRNFPTLRYLAAPFRWLFRSRRRALIAAAVLLAMIAVLPLWWSIQLVGLPDIGEPFDVAAFRKFTIPDDRNAFVLYREAAERLKPLIAPNGMLDVRTELNIRWSEAEPEIRGWVEENREVLEIFRRGAERPDAFEPDLASNWNASWKLVRSIRPLQTLALLEASRREGRGDMAGAWVWYRGCLRANYHLGMRATVMMRQMAEYRNDELRRRISTWAEDPRTTAVLLRRALDDAVACGAIAPSELDTLEALYCLVERGLTDPYNEGRQAFVQRLIRSLPSRSYHLSPDQARAIADIWRFWRREPERSRRALRLAIANWLAYEDLPPEKRPKPDPDVTGPYDFYAFGPEAPAKARVLSPGALDRWMSTAIDAQGFFDARGLRRIRAKERANHRALVTLLAGELYRRDRGTYPPTDEALVGPYLKELPDDGSGDTRDAPGQPVGGAVQ